MTTTIIPSAPDTVTDLEAPEREPDVLRVGGLVLKRTAECETFWIRRVDMPGCTGDASVLNHRRIWSAELDWLKTDSSEAVKVTAQGANPEAALAKARKLGNFPDEFFEALSKEIEES